MTTLENGYRKTEDGVVLPTCTLMVDNEHGAGWHRCGKPAAYVTTTRAPVTLLCEECFQAGVRRAAHRKEATALTIIRGDSFFREQVWPLVPPETVDALDSMQRNGGHWMDVIESLEGETA